MTNIPATDAAPAAATTPKKGKGAPHPTSAAMVIEAITKLKGKEGTSLQAIKKYIADVHKVDTEKQGFHIRKALKNAVATGKLTRVKGKGASGSFKLAEKSQPEKQAPVAKMRASTSPKPKKGKSAKEAKPAVKKTTKIAKSLKVKASKKTTAPKKAPSKKGAKMMRASN